MTEIVKGNFTCLFFDFPLFDHCPVFVPQTLLDEEAVNDPELNVLHALYCIINGISFTITNYVVKFVGPIICADGKIDSLSIH